jgi:hypothetical protein
MCFSAAASYSAAVVLAGTGCYALQLAGRMNSPYWRMWALVPVFFAVQQAFEGRVWQLLNAGEPAATLPFAYGFHFFSHFLWLWWLPLASYLVEPGTTRKRVFGACTIVGALLGTLVFSVMLLHPEWMTVGMREHSISYRFSVPYRSSIHLPIKPAAIYALVILVPLLFSSYRELKVFGWLAALFSVLTSQFYGYAYISVWCFFAAVLSLYLVHMIRHYSAPPTAVQV